MAYDGVARLEVVILRRSLRISKDLVEASWIGEGKPRPIDASLMLVASVVDTIAP